MPAFDGPFADTYVLPFATAAYVSTTPPAGFAQSWEILSSPAAAATHTAGIASAHIAPPNMSAYNAMTMQPPVPLPPGQTPPAIKAHGLVPTPPNLHFGWLTADINKGIFTIAIRGTQYFEEWLKDFDFLAVPYQPIAGSGLVHQGFQIVYYSIRDSIRTVLAEARTAFPAITQVLITGHSLGAAVVGIAAPDILGGPATGLTPLVYTFAEPRVGHPDYKSFFDAHVPVCFRINNIWDIVPRVPPILALYEHEGQELDINSGFSLDVSHNHALATGYAPGLAKWVADHPATAAHVTALGFNPILLGVSP